MHLLSTYHSNVSCRSSVADPTSSDVHIYFVDSGEEESLARASTRLLPQEFLHQPSFAIPCRLDGICSRYSDDPSIWNSNDPVHAEMKHLLSTNFHCTVQQIQHQTCYDVQIDIPRKFNRRADPVDRIDPKRHLLSSSMCVSTSSRSLRISG